MGRETDVPSGSKSMAPYWYKKKFTDKLFEIGKELKSRVKVKRLYMRKDTSADTRLNVLDNVLDLYIQ